MDSLSSVTSGAEGLIVMEGLDCALPCSAATMALGSVIWAGGISAPEPSPRACGRGIKGRTGAMA